MKKLFLFLSLFSLLRMSGLGQETGILSGTLRDQLTNDPLFGVKVTASGHVTRTDEAGVFNLDLPPGSFDIRFNRYGLQTLNLPGMNISGGDTVLVDTTLVPVIVPVSGVFAEDDGYTVEVNWAAYGPGISEKGYDDGQVNEFYVNEESGGQVAVKYHSDGWEHVIGGRIFVGDGIFPGPFLGTEFIVKVYDDQGMSGLPGNIIDEDTVVVDQYGWIGFDSLDALIRTDSFYMAMYQINNMPFCAPIGCSAYPVNSNTVAKLQAYNWQTFAGNAMIRPWVSTPHDSLRITKFRVARYSGFCLECDPQSGTLNELASTNSWHFTDNAVGWVGGCYAYGIKALYNNGLYSDYEVSNIVCVSGKIHVTIKLNLPDSSSDGLTRIKLTGQTIPYHKYSMVIQNSVSGGFDDVNYGKYMLEIYKPGFDKIIRDSIDIQSDTLIEITLQENCYPVEDLTVNPFTGLLKWESHNIVQFSWQNDTGDTCHSVTTPELDLTLAPEWVLTVFYHYNSIIEPATVDYSTDHGRTWAEFYALSPQPGWDTVNIDLSTFSGQNGEQEIMFQIHDYHGEPYALDLGKVRVWTPDLEPLPKNCLISLNGETAGSSDTTFYQLTSLVNGNSYHAGVYVVNCAGQTDTISTDFIYRQLFPPENLISYDKNDSLFFSWSSPAGSWDGKPGGVDYPGALTGYILHLESNNISIDIEISDPQDTSYQMRKMTCDTTSVSVIAIYDLSDYGYPGENFESIPEGPFVLMGPGTFEGEFFEDWSSMSFYVNCWEIEGNGLSLRGDAGNPGPAFVFQNTDEPYQAFLTSYPILIPQTLYWNLVLEFDLKLLTNGESGHETLEFQVLQEGSNDWIMVKGISNLFGNIDWMHFSVDLGSFVETPLFRLRLKFAGYGGEASWWTIDNIYVHNLCPGPGSINAEKMSESEVRLNWRLTKPKAENRDLERYRIYRDYNDTEYEQLNETVDTSYVDMLTYGGKYCYRLTAVYNDEGVVCESPLSDSACITSSLGIHDEILNSRVICFPNPAGEFVMIKSEEEIRLIELYNSLGIIIKAIDNPGLSYRLDLNEIPGGIYLIRVDLKDDVVLKKIIHQ
jgi:hypothetical protein